MGRSPVLALVLALATLLGSTEVCVTAQDAPDPDEVTGLDDLPPLPPIKVTAAPRYLLGFPLVVSVTLDNTSKYPSFWRNLPGVALTSGPGPIGATFRREDGFEHVHTAARLDGVGHPPRAFKLAPKVDRTMLCDLTSAAPDEPGRYTVTLCYAHQGHQVDAAPFQVELVAPSEADAEAAQALLKQAKMPTWGSFLEDNWRTVDATKLSPAAREALAFHLFVHRAVYGPDGLAALDPAPLRALGAPYQDEAKLLELELLLARKDEEGAAALRASLAGKKGLAWRVEQIDAGNGWLASLRKARGAERAGRPKTQPYGE